jgi:Tfp pilus assembly protein PilF
MEPVTATLTEHTVSASNVPALTAYRTGTDGMLYVSAGAESSDAVMNAVAHDQDDNESLFQSAAVMPVAHDHPHTKIADQDIDHEERQAPKKVPQATGSMIMDDDGPGAEEETPLTAKSDSGSETGRIEIISSGRAGPINDLITAAYAKYSAGDYSAARADYLQALKDRPDNRDALLGMAAIAYRDGDMELARTAYLRILKHYPEDATAQLALINLPGLQHFAEREKILKEMLQANPASPSPYIMLGNLYLAASRWLDARESFYNAWRLDQRNPDCAYNLAVSLDHMGQKDEALEYYLIAHKLSDKRMCI